MPGKQHVRGVGAKEQRMYEHIKEYAEKSGRYGGRAFSYCIVRSHLSGVARASLDRNRARCEIR